MTYDGKLKILTPLNGFGETGIQGVTGIAGIGVTGIAGINGVTGVAGADGAAGATGVFPTVSDGIVNSVSGVYGSVTTIPANFMPGSLPYTANAFQVDQTYFNSLITVNAISAVPVYDTGTIVFSEVPPIGTYLNFQNTNPYDSRSAIEFTDNNTGNNIDVTGGISLSDLATAVYNLLTSTAGSTYLSFASPVLVGSNYEITVTSKIPPFWQQHSIQINFAFPPMGAVGISLAGVDDSGRLDGGTVSAVILYDITNAVTHYIYADTVSPPFWMTNTFVYAPTGTIYGDVSAIVAAIPYLYNTYLPSARLPTFLPNQFAIQHSSVTPFLVGTQFSPDLSHNTGIIIQGLGEGVVFGDSEGKLRTIGAGTSGQAWASQGPGQPGHWTTISTAPSVTTVMGVNSTTVTYDVVPSDDLILLIPDPTGFSENIVINLLPISSAPAKELTIAKVDNMGSFSMVTVNAYSGDAINSNSSTFINPSGFGRNSFTIFPVLNAPLNPSGTISIWTITGNFNNAF